MINSIGPSGKLLWLCNAKNSTQHTNSYIPHIFDHWADPVVHLLLLKSSMAKDWEEALWPIFEMLNSLPNL